MHKRWAVSPRNHILPLVAVSLLMGCRAAVQLQPGRWLWGLLAIALALAVLSRHLGACRSLALALCCFVLGTLRTTAALCVPQPDPGRYSIGGYVQGGSRLRDDQRVNFTLTDVTLDEQPAPGSAYVSLHYDTEPPKLYDGAYVRFEGRVYLPDGKAGETHMDFRLWMRQNHMSFGIAAYQEIQCLNTPDTAPVKDLAYRVRQRMERALKKVMGGEASVAMSMLAGQREGLAEEERKAFATLGIVRVTSVSGMQVALLAALTAHLLRRLRLGRLAVLLAQAILLVGYGWLTGFFPSTVRAACMLLCYGLARLSGRCADRMSPLALSAILLLLVRPLDAFSAGFVMSFCAMLGLLLCTTPVREWLEKTLPVPDDRKKRSRLYRRLRGRLARGLSLSTAAQAGVLLPTAVYFHQLPLYGLLMNLLLMPLAAGVLLPLYILLLPASAIPWVGSALGILASWLTRGFLWLVSLLSRLPYASIRVAAPNPLLCIAIGVAALILSRRVPGRGGRKALAAGLCLALGITCAVCQCPPSLRYIQLAVGQADSALLLDGDQTILIDAGDDGQAALDILLNEGRSVDALFISHLHMDHIGGVQALLEENIPIRQVYLPKDACAQKVDPDALALLQRMRDRGICVTELAKGDRLRYNDSAVSVLWPNQPRSGGDANAMSMVLCIDFGGYRILSAADLTGEYEKYAAASADVLKVAHHGSAKSTGEDFLHTVRPQAALISCSSGSAYLPSPATLERLKDIPVLRTDQCGDITLTIQHGQLVITPYKERNPL